MRSSAAAYVMFGGSWMMGGGLDRTNQNPGWVDDLRVFDKDQEAAFYAGKVVTGKFFANENLITVKARCRAIKDGDKSALELVDLGFTV